MPVFLEIIIINKFFSACTIRHDRGLIKNIVYIMYYTYIYQLRGTIQIRNKNVIENPRGTEFNVKYTVATNAINDTLVQYEKKMDVKIGPTRRYLNFAILEP